jgi:hypothetical protein
MMLFECSVIMGVYLIVNFRRFEYASRVEYNKRPPRLAYFFARLLV